MIKKTAQQSKEKPVETTDKNATDANEAKQETATIDTALQEALGKIQSYEQELADSRDKQLRVFAEAENVKKRAQKDVEATRKFALEGFVKSLLPVLDSFIVAKKTIPADQKEVTDGVEMIENTFVSILNEHGVAVINPDVGEPFNPDIHQAMTTKPAEKGQESNTVVEVFQRGFSLQGRLIRPALVVVVQ